MVSAKGKLRSGWRWREGSGPDGRGSTQTLYCTQGFRYGRCEREGKDSRSAVARQEHASVIEEWLARGDGNAREIGMGGIEQHVPVSANGNRRDFKCQRPLTLQPLSSDSPALAAVELKPVTGQRGRVELLDLSVGDKGFDHGEIVWRLVRLKVDEVFDSGKRARCRRVNDQVPLLVPAACGVHTARSGECLHRVLSA